MKTVYLSLGSNVGKREEMLQEALRRMDAGGVRVRRVSRVYETEPQEVRGQPWFLNLAAEVETELLPRQLLARLRKIELQLGRRRRRPKGPREIDIDILLYGEAVIKTGELTIPHPRMAERRFVLQPLADLNPELRHPVCQRSVRDLLAALRGQAAHPVPGLDFNAVARERGGRK